MHRVLLRRDFLNTDTAGLASIFSSCNMSHPVAEKSVSISHVHSWQTPAGSEDFWRHGVSRSKAESCFLPLQFVTCTYGYCVFLTCTCLHTGSMWQGARYAIWIHLIAVHLLMSKTRRNFDSVYSTLGNCRTECKRVTCTTIAVLRAMSRRITLETIQLQDIDVD